MDIAVPMGPQGEDQVTQNFENVKISSKTKEVVQ